MRKSENEKVIILNSKEQKMTDYDQKTNKKEHAYYRLNHQTRNRYTRSQMVDERKKKEDKYNSDHFQLKIKGMHGGDLPSFYKTKKEWWKWQKFYVENPENKSQSLLIQDRKWARNDDILLADFNTEEAPKDAFKVHLGNRKKIDKVSEKPNCRKVTKSKHHSKKK